jgi:energy-coupling factor transporter ATP-binding protein EcfA2
MSGSESRPPHHLSVGQKKRVALAGVLAMDARVLVLDEPSAGLDPRGRRELISLLADLDRPKIIATHDLDLAAEVCSRGVLLDDGRVVAEGPIEELLVNAPLLEEHGLDRPPAGLVARLAAGREQPQLV